MAEIRTKAGLQQPSLDPGASVLRTLPYCTPQVFAAREAALIRGAESRKQTDVDAEDPNMPNPCIPESGLGVVDVVKRLADPYLRARVSFGGNYKLLL